MNAWDRGYESGRKRVEKSCVRNSGFLPGWDVVAYFIDRRGEGGE